MPFHHQSGPAANNPPPYIGENKFVSPGTNYMVEESAINHDKIIKSFENMNNSSKKGPKDHSPNNKTKLISLFNHPQQQDSTSHTEKFLFKYHPTEVEVNPFKFDYQKDPIPKTPSLKRASPSFQGTIGIIPRRRYLSSGVRTQQNSEISFSFERESYVRSVLLKHQAIRIRLHDHRKHPGEDSCGHCMQVQKHPRRFGVCD